MINKEIANRNYLLDIARIVATLAVVMLHSSSRFVSYYNPQSVEFLFGNLFDGMSRLGVPLFLMISGSLILDENKNITLKSILSKNIKNLAIITVIWSIIYAAIFNVVMPLLNDQTVNVKSFLVKAVCGHYHMWYLFMIIGLYMAVPFLRAFVRKENKKMVLFFILVSLCFEFLTYMINALCKLGIDLSIINKWLGIFELDFFGGYIAYFLAGWYITHIGIKQKWLRYFIFVLGAASLAFVILFTQYTGDYKNVYQNIGLPVFIYAISVFLFINNLKFKFKEKTVLILAKLSKLTFGVYIVHPIVLHVFISLIPNKVFVGIYIVFSFAVVVFVSLIFSYIVSKIPVVKNIVRA